MNNPQIDKIINFLISEYPNSYKDLIKSYKDLSKDDSNKRNLVSSEMTGIWFDRLGKWLYKRDNKHGEVPKSADSLTFSENRIILIEFKTGDQESNGYKRRDLLENVSGKIIGSEEIINTCIFKKRPDIKQEELELNFFLVIDANAMGVTPLGEALINLSVGAEQLKEERVVRMLTDLFGHFHVEEHPRYKKIDIWYSTSFEYFLKVENIKDIKAIIAARVG